MIEPDIPRDWLTTQLVSKATETADRSERDSQIQRISESMANLRTDWDRIFGDIRPDDEIWEFDSPAEHWVSLCGRAGIALVREGAPIAGVVTELN